MNNMRNDSNDMSMRPFEFHVLTLFPAMISDAVSHSILGKAVESGTVRVSVHDIRDHTTDRHRTADDEPYGGGPGMVMKVGPVTRCLAETRRKAPPASPCLLLSASGPVFNQAMAHGLAEEGGLILVCGHYEGVDERVAEHYVDAELSVGDYVMSGGEIPALVVIDTVSRLLPGVLGNVGSLAEESHVSGLVEYPQYTRPATFDGHDVPSVLLSGNHAEIEAYRNKQAIEKTRRNRPDLYECLDIETGDDDSTPVLGRPGKTGDR